MPNLLAAIILTLSSASAIAQTATEKTLYSFTGGSDGAVLGCCGGGLILSNDGNFYGTTYSGGSYEFGTIFRLSQAGSFSSFYSFQGLNDGAHPETSVIEGNDGNLYGTASDGGYDANGSIFRIAPSSTFSTLYSFRGGSDGGEPATGLIQGADQNFYSADANLSGGGIGALYKISPSGTFASLAAFNSSEDIPAGSVVQGTDGDFYALSQDSIYKFDSGGSLTKLKSLDSCGVGGGLTEGVDGEYYGSYCTYNGSDFSVVFFKISSAGVLNSLDTVLIPGNSSGYGLARTLLLGSDGNFYGVTPAGGANGYGQVFRLTSAGVFTTIYSFTNGDDGENPTTGVAQGADGNLYGVASGGLSGSGVIFKITLSPALPAPVALSFSSSSVNAYSPVTLSWVVPNAASMTLQQCYASVQGNPGGAGTWAGLQTGAFSDGIYFGSSSITPTVAGTYTYALTCGGVESGFATLTVNAANRTATTSTLTASPNPATVGQYVTFSDTVKKTSGTGEPTGSVTFYYATNVLSSVALNGSGIASLVVPTAELPVGSYAITADYGGDTSDSPSTSNVITEQVKAASNAVLNASPNVVSQDATTTLSARVSSPSGMPTGSVSFYYGSVSLGSAVLNAQGSAVFPVQANVPSGSYSLTTVYSGDVSHAAATSAPTTVTVK